MEYTISAFAQLSGVSSRTLRYYDEIGLLNPAAVSDKGYRLYGPREADRLQQILYFKSLGLPLDTIMSILAQSKENVQALLQQHYQQLLLQRKELDEMLHVLADTLASYRGEKKMTDQEKFTYFKTHSLPESEALYDAEAKEQYGADLVAKNQQMWRAMPEETYIQLAAEEERLLQLLSELLNNPAAAIPSTKAEAAFSAHKNWLAGAAPFYSDAYHRTLAEMYVSDSRFTDYYDQKAGATAILKQVIEHYTQT